MQRAHNTMYNWQYKSIRCMCMLLFSPTQTPLIKSTLQIYVSHSSTRCTRILAGHLNAREDRIKERIATAGKSKLIQCTTRTTQENLYIFEVKCFQSVHYKSDCRLLLLVSYHHSTRHSHGKAFVGFIPATFEGIII